MLIAKMHTRYPELHGEGYYNFIMSEYKDELEELVADNSHDFSLVEVKELDMELDDIMEKYPTKQDLNKGVFK